jgi:uncharacterized protein YbjT (DUF2867 family)
VNIVVAGGTGFLGRHISSALIAGGHDVTVLVRHPEEVTRIAELAGAKAVGGDVTDSTSLVDKLAGAEAVVAAVQFPNHPIEVPRKGLTYDRFDRQGVENLVAEARRAGVKRFFYISGARADPGSDKTWYRAKGRAEDAVRDSGLQWCILRPSWAYGPEDRALNRFALFARLSPVIPKPGAEVQRIQPVHVDDIALAVQRAFERDEAWGRVFEIGGPEVMTMDEVIRTMCEVMGKRRVILPIPAALAKLGSAPLMLLPKPPMTPQGIEFAVQDGVVDNSETERVLDVHPVPLREGLSRYLERASRRGS